jgi:predicted ester cyclase
MPVLSVMSIQGDPDELVARMQEMIDPVARLKAPEYGAISSTVVRTDDGIKIFNLWETDEGRHKMAEDPEIQVAIRAAAFPEPHFTGYEVLVQRSAAQTAKELEQRIADEVWTQGKLDVIDEVIAPDFVGSSPTDGEFHGPEGFRQLVERYHSAFSDVRMTLDRVVGEGDWVATHWTASGTHNGDLMGIAPTGREVTVTGVEFSRVEGGKLVESHGLFDALGMLQQLGAVPAGAPAGARG